MGPSCGTLRDGRWKDSGAWSVRTARVGRASEAKQGGGWAAGVRETLSDLLNAVQRTDGVEGIDVGRETAVQAENLVSQRDIHVDDERARSAYFETEVVKRRWCQQTAPATHLPLDQCREGKVIKEVGKGVPHGRCAILSQAFVVKAVDLRNLSALMVAPQNGDALGVADLVKGGGGWRRSRRV